jgi:hypothetical protein
VATHNRGAPKAAAACSAWLLMFPDVASSNEIAVICSKHEHFNKDNLRSSGAIPALALQAQHTQQGHSNEVLPAAAAASNRSKGCIAEISEAIAFLPYNVVALCKASLIDWTQRCNVRVQHLAEPGDFHTLGLCTVHHVALNLCLLPIWKAHA